MARGSLKRRGLSFVRFGLAFVTIVELASVAALGASAGARSFSVDTGEPPTSVTSSADGTLLFVGLDRHFSDPGGIAAYRRAGAETTALGSIELAEGAQGLALTPDESSLLFTTRTGPGIVAVATLLHTGRHGGAVVQRDGNIAGSDQIVVARDGRYAFYTNQRDASLGVVRIDRASDGTPSLSIVGHVALDRLPAGIALSADGTTLYVTSEIDNVDPQSVPGASDSRLGRTSCDVNLGPHGVLSVIDTRLAVDDPIHAVRFRIAAGCAPVRVALSSRGDVAWVSVRGEDRVLAFSTSKLMDDNEHALLAQLAVGPEPIGILATHDGAELMVAASDGESQAHRPRRSRLEVFDTAAVLGGGVTAACETSPAGRRPRELYESADGTIWVTDYDGRAVVAFAGETSVATLGRTPSAAIQRSRCST